VGLEEDVSRLAFDCRQVVQVARDLIGIRAVPHVMTPAMRPRHRCSVGESQRLAGVSVSWLSQVVRGERAPDSLRCLITVANV
ncbi:MAG: hypothetical protein JWM18_1283, partial [Chloroflexi bacterium]|nr:hypothetical protein [Chloroflexota bacterium]